MSTEAITSSSILGNPCIPHLADDLMVVNQKRYYDNKTITENIYASKHHDCRNLAIFCNNKANPGLLTDPVSRPVSLTVLWKGEYVNMNREGSEMIGQTLRRLTKRLQNLSGKCNEKSKKTKTTSGSNKVSSTLKKSHHQQPIIEDVSDNDVQLVSAKGVIINKESDISCEEAFKKALAIRIHDVSLCVLNNPPKVTDLTVFGYSVVGLPIIIQFEIDEEKYDTNSFIVSWWNADADGLFNHVDEFSLQCIKPDSDSIILPTPFHKGRYYIPTVDDVGKIFKVTAAHPDYPCLGEKITISPICLNLTDNWVKERLEEFKQPCRKDDTCNTSLTNILLNDIGVSNIIRVASFNILADEYARTAKASTVIFPYCSKDAISLKYRAPRLLAEMLNIDCDIVAIQECSLKFYKDFLLPVLYPRYMSHFTMKTGRVEEGCVILYDANKFEEIEFLEFDFKTALLSESNLKELLASISITEPHFLTHVLPYMTTIYQISVLRVRQEKNKSKIQSPLILFSNTHLFFHPKASHVRLLQTYLLLHRISTLRAQYTETGYSSVSVILAGDFNSLLNSAVYSLMANGLISSTHPDWNFGFVFTDKTDIDTDIGGTGSFDELPHCNNYNESTHSDETHFSGLHKEKNLNRSRGPEYELSVPTNLKSLTDVYKNEEHRITNVVNGFFGTLDYLFITTDTLKMRKVLPGVPFNILTSKGGLPSIDYPSDHLAIAAELQLC